MIAVDEQIRLTAIVVAYNSALVIERCLQSITGHCSATHEVIIVDNASVDGTAGLVAARFPWLRIIRNPDNVGFAAANNQAIHLAKGEYVVLVNPDALIVGSTLDRMIAHLDRCQDVGISGATHLLPDGTECPAVTVYPTPARYALWLLSGRWGWPTSGPSAGFVSGACLMIRRDCISEIGLLDESYFMYAEDADWCLRAETRGWAVRTAPGAHIVHAGGASAASDYSARVYNGRQGKLRFAEKHFTRRAQIALKLLMAAEAVAKLLYDVSLYGFRATGRRRFYRQRIAGYWRLLVHLPRNAEFKVPDAPMSSSVPGPDIPKERSQVSHIVGT